MTITVYSMPVANPDQYGTLPGQALNVITANGVLANDTDADGGTLSATLVAPPANGNLTLNPDGSFSYTPNAGFTGTDSFTYTASDSHVTSQPATVTITVYSIPVANPDQYTTLPGQTLTVDAWSNARVAILAPNDGDDTFLANELAAAVPDVQVPVMGLLSDLTAANLEWLAGAGASIYGVNTLLIWQSQDDIDPDLWGLAISLGFQTFVVSDPAILLHDVMASPLCTPGGVLDNDTNADGLPLSAQLVTSTTNGSLTLNSDGSFSYTPHLGFAGTDSFTYTATDGHATSQPATVTIYVYSTPVANPDQYATQPGQLLDVNTADGVLANDSNADGNPLTANLVTPPANGTLVLDGDGSFTYTPNAGFTGTDSFSYTASDAYATSAPATVTITVYSVPVANPDVYTTPENQTLTVNAHVETIEINSDIYNDDYFLNYAIEVANIHDIAIPLWGVGGLDDINLTWDAGPLNPVYFNTFAVWQVPVSPDIVAFAQSLGYQVFASNDLNTLVNDIRQASTRWYGGILANDANADGLRLSAQLDSTTSHGILTLTPDGSFVYTPYTGFCGTDVFTYTAADGQFTSAPTTVTIYIYSTPVANPDAYNAVQGQQLAVSAANSVLANDTNQDGNPLTATVASQPSHGTLTFNSDGSFHYTSASNFFGTDTFTYTASSSYATSAPATVSLTVYSMPLAKADNYGTMLGQSLTVSATDGVLANDTNADGNPLSATLVTQPAHGSLTFNSDGSFQYTPDAAFIGTDSFTYAAVNGPATSAPATVTIAMCSTPVANPDSYIAIQGQFLDIGAGTTEQLMIFADTPADDTTLANALAAGAPNAPVVFSDVGSNLVAYELNSIRYLGNTLVIWQVPLSPYLQALAQELGYQVFASDDLTTLVNDVQQHSNCLIGGVLANDTDASGLPLSAQLITPTSHGELFLNTDGSFTYWPYDSFYGTDSFTYTATNGYAVSAPVTVTITVYSQPVASPDTYTTYMGQPLTITTDNGLLANDTNADGNPLTAIVVDPPANGTLTLDSDGSFQYQPTPDVAGGPDIFYYIAVNRPAASALTPVSIMIYGLPVANPDEYTTVAGQTLASPPITACSPMTPMMTAIR